MEFMQLLFVPKEQTLFVSLKSRNDPSPLWLTNKLFTVDSQILILLVSEVEIRGWFNVKDGDWDKNNFVLIFKDEADAIRLAVSYSTTLSDVDKQVHEERSEQFLLSI